MLPLLLSCDQESNQRSLIRPVPRLVKLALRQSLNQNKRDAHGAMIALSELKHSRSTDGGDLVPIPGSHQRCCLAKAAVKNVLPAVALFRGQDI
jgi:hypothetical protein